MHPSPTYTPQQEPQQNVNPKLKLGSFASRNAAKRHRMWGQNNNITQHNSVVAHWGFKDVATTRMGFKERLNIATLNPRGLNEPGKMDIIDGWAHNKKIMVLTLE